MLVGLIASLIQAEGGSSKWSLGTYDAYGIQVFPVENCAGSQSIHGTEVPGGALSVQQLGSLSLLLRDSGNF